MRPPLVVSFRRNRIPFPTQCLPHLVDEQYHIADGSGGGTPILCGSGARSSSDGANNEVFGTEAGIGEDDPKGCAADNSAAVQAGLDRTRVVRALSHGILNGILLSPVAVSVMNV